MYLDRDLNIHFQLKSSLPPPLTLLIRTKSCAHTNFGMGNQTTWKTGGHPGGRIVWEKE
jgi:hypothetical protein